jgi:DNA-binding response OmpR family regulator
MMSKTICIVEDNPDIADVLDIYLQEEGFEVTLFDTASAFLSTYQKQHNDIFLLDVMLPDGDGISLCNHIKQDPAFSHIPVVIMSAHSQAETINKNSKSDAFIKKPFDLNELKDQLNLLLS